jgi:mxaJ protein
MNRNSLRYITAAIVAIGASWSISAHCSLGVEPKTLVVAADPNNMPFSNESEEGFENKLATLVARDLNAQLHYIWQPQRRGFFKDTLGASKCDAVMGAPAGLSGCLTSQPYYRSSYVFVASKSNDRSVQSLNDEILHKWKIGVQLMGDGQMSPPAYALIERGLADNLVGFSMYNDDHAENPAAEIIRAVAAKKVDLAIAWGPIAGYLAQQSTGLVIKPIPQPSSAPEPYAFDICVGIRKDNPALRDEIDVILRHRRSEIVAILDEFAVPRGVEPAGESSKHESATR